VHFLAETSVATQVTALQCGVGSSQLIAWVKLCVRPLLSYLTIYWHIILSVARLWLRWSENRRSASEILLAVSIEIVFQWENCR